MTTKNSLYTIYKAVFDMNYNKKIIIKKKRTKFRWQNAKDFKDEISNGLNVAVYLWARSIKPLNKI